MKKRKFVPGVFYIFLSLALLCSLLSVSSFAQQGGSLYNRLGGSYSISAIVDDFVEGLLADPLVTGNEKVVASVNKITKPALKFHMTEFICQATGGPQKYTGKSMKESHKGLNISESEWAAMEKALLASLTKFNVLDLEQKELLAIVTVTKQDVVTAKSPPPQEATVAPAQAAPEVTPPPQAAPEATQVAPEVVPPPPQEVPEAQIPQEAAPALAPVGEVAEPSPTPIIAPAIIEPPSAAPQVPPPSVNVAPSEVIPGLPPDPDVVGPIIPPGTTDSAQPLP